MKIIAIVMLLFFLTIATNVFMDMGIGLRNSQLLINQLNPFWAMGAGEYIMVIFLFGIIIGQPIYYNMKNKAKNEDGSN
jgi:Na+/proline symporter